MAVLWLYQNKILGIYFRPKTKGPGINVHKTKPTGVLSTFECCEDCEHLIKKTTFSFCNEKVRHCCWTREQVTLSRTSVGEWHTLIDAKLLLAAFKCSRAHQMSNSIPVIFTSFCRFASVQASQNFWHICLIILESSSCCQYFAKFKSINLKWYRLNFDLEGNWILKMIIGNNATHQSNFYCTATFSQI